MVRPCGGADGSLSLGKAAVRESPCAEQATTSSDIGNTVANGSETCEQLRRDLIQLHALILEHVKASDTMCQSFDAGVLADPAEQCEAEARALGH